MNAKVAQNEAVSTSDIVKYVIAGLLAVAALAGFYWFSTAPTALRVVGMLVGFGLAIAVFMLSAKGRDTREFFAETRFELRKVVWPTRQETTRTTGLIIVVVIVISLILALFDLVISTGVRALLGA
ncbi:preprotein translocase subunit SecE [Aquimonas voraii]|uniref:Protein translocase subunit SecE n=1 Tax=Aquimonas voraii TaxID=265719 RepID=A0A1G7AKD2_9GAMM|nr:preprotein translocase subunit SecE [Aquimonas voraii]SDE14336.1 protein translocase subunit secE/sec61 gamma [Aquimonas voraii]